MKKIKIDNQTKLIATLNNRNEINYYIVTAKNEKFYAFTRVYTTKTWELCKSGIRLNELLHKRTSNEGVMLLVKYAKYIIPYLYEEYGLATV